MAVIAVYSMKGGVGKTTMAVDLAWRFSQTGGHETLLYDLDQSIRVLTPDRAKDDPEINRLIHVYHNLLRRWAQP